MVNVTYVEKGKQKTSCVRRGEWVSKVKTQLKKDIVAHYEKQLITFKAKELKEMVDKCVESNSLDSLPVGIQEQYILTDVYKMGRRNKWVSESPVQTQLRKDLKDIGLEAVEIEMLLVECASKNSLEPLIEHLDIENYVLEDHYIYGEVNQENVDKLIADFAKDIEAIIAKGTEEDNWQREPIGDSQSFYCNVLCGYKKYCKYYTDYRKQITEYTSENFTSNDDLLNELENL
jgi:hypothetical protein